jgi:MFS family permease
MKHPFRFLYAVGFIFSVQYGLVVYINSSFLELSVGEKSVGLVFTIASLVSILFLLEAPRLLSRFGNYRAAIAFVSMNAVSLVLLAVLPPGFPVVIAFLLYTVSNYSLLLVLDVFIEECEVKGSVGRTRGIFLTLRNVAILIAPGAAILIVTHASYAGVYLAAAVSIAMSLFFIVPHFKNFKDPVYSKISVRTTLEKIFRNADLKKIYGSQLLLCFFYAWMIIYMPIYLHQHVGLPWEHIGIILTIMLIPFTLLDYPLGRLSDTIGEKKLLLGGFFIAAVATAAIFFIHTQSIFVWALVLFITRVGAATVEVMNESYFFKKILASDADLIGVFRNMFPVAFVVAPLIAIPVLFLVPSFKYLFLVLGIIMFLGFLITLRLRDAK